MNKKEVIFITIFVLVLVVLVVYVIVLLKPEESVYPDVTEVEINRITEYDKLLYPSEQGSVEINNFTKQAVELTPERIALLLEGSQGIVYSPNDWTFYITINPTTIEEMQILRTEVENKLLSILGVTQQDACKLRVVIRTLPAPYVTEVDSQTFGLSYCNGN